MVRVISLLTGEVAVIGLDQLVLDVQGVGYAVRVPPPVLESARRGRTLTLHTEMVVREDAITLFGFPDPDELDIFRRITTVTGVGPKIGLAVLSVMTPEQLRTAVALDDAKAITAVPGIGPKVAQRMVLELKDRIGAPSAAELPAAAPAVDAAAQRATEEVVAALAGLGWPEKAARDAVGRALEVEAAERGSAAEVPSAVLLRSALRLLGGSR
jgi:holliday junction DNA helicase RuvA